MQGSGLVLNDPSDVGSVHCSGRVEVGGGQQLLICLFHHLYIYISDLWVNL
jgi:hypothetical protein